MATAEARASEVIVGFRFPIEQHRVLMSGAPKLEAARVVGAGLVL